MTTDGSQYIITIQEIYLDNIWPCLGVPLCRVKQLVEAVSHELRSNCVLTQTVQQRVFSVLFRNL